MNKGSSYFIFIPLWAASFWWCQNDSNPNDQWSVKAKFCVRFEKNTCNISEIFRLVLVLKCNRKVPSAMMSVRQYCSIVCMQIKFYYYYCVSRLPSRKQLLAVWQFCFLQFAALMLIPQLVNVPKCPANHFVLDMWSNGLLGLVLLTYQSKTSLCTWHTPPPWNHVLVGSPGSFSLGEHRPPRHFSSSP